MANNNCLAVNGVLIAVNGILTMILITCVIVIISSDDDASPTPTATWTPPSQSYPSPTPQATADVQLLRINEEHMKLLQAFETSYLVPLALSEHTLSNGPVHDSEGEAEDIAVARRARAGDDVADVAAINGAYQSLIDFATVTNALRAMVTTIVDQAAPNIVVFPALENVDEHENSVQSEPHFYDAHTRRGGSGDDPAAINCPPSTTLICHVPFLNPAAFVNVCVSDDWLDSWFVYAPTDYEWFVQSGGVESPCPTDPEEICNLVGDVQEPVGSPTSCHGKECKVLREGMKYPKSSGLNVNSLVVLGDTFAHCPENDGLCMSLCDIVYKILHDDDPDPQNECPGPLGIAYDCDAGTYTLSFAQCDALQTVTLPLPSGDLWEIECTLEEAAFCPAMTFCVAYTHVRQPPAPCA